MVLVSAKFPSLSDPISALNNHMHDVDNVFWPVAHHTIEGVTGGSSSMKSSHHFRDYLSVMSEWFEQWNSCEQTVALYSLVKKIGPVHARFLALQLEQNIASEPALQLQEQQANDPGYINSLSSESKETAVSQLLSHLPLLRPGNEAAKGQYLGLIPKILAHSIRHSVHIEESRQLLSYSLIHPAISHEDRCTLTQWLRQLEERISNNCTRVDPWRSTSGSFIGNGVETTYPPILNHLGSNSLPPGLGGHVTLQGLGPVSPSLVSPHPDGTKTLPLVRSASPLGGSPEHAPLSPQSSITSSGSDDAFMQDGTGMKDVPCWLKGLRLHKYAYIFKNMTYEEMMSISEEKLEQMSITKGARHKIVLSIQKLRERQSNLESLEKDLQEGEGSVHTILNELKSMLQTPIKPSNGNSESSSEVEGDLPHNITRLLGKICSSLLISSNQDEDLNFYVMVVDKCLSHEAFTPVQKRRLFSWKQQIQRASHPLPPRRSLDSRSRIKWNNYQNSTVQSCDDAEGRRRGPPPYVRQMSANFTSNRSPAVIKRPSLQEHMKPHVQIQRTNSAPVRPNPLPASIFGKIVDGVDSTDPELNIRLESLCLSVTEHALGSFDGAVPLF